MWFTRKSETDKFQELLLRSGLIDEVEIGEVRKAHRTKWRGIGNLEEVCSHLVANGSLTQWQVDKLRNGKFRGFFWDNYKIIDHLGVGNLSTAFLAEDTDTGTRVILCVTPTIRGPMTYEAFDSERT